MGKRKSLAILLFNLIVYAIVAQNQTEIDRIHTQLSGAANVEEKLLCFSDLSWEYSLYDLDSSLYFANKTLLLAIKTNNTPYKATAYNRIGLAYDSFNQLDSAIKNYNIALNIRQNLKDTVAMSNTLNDIGACYFYQSVLDSAVKYYLKAAGFRQKMKDNKLLAQSFNNLGLVHRKQKNYEKAIYYYKQSILYKEESNDEEGILNSLSNISIAYQQNNNFNEAEKYSLKAVALAKKLNLEGAVALENNSLGVIYRNMGDLEKAKTYLLEANKYLQKKGRKGDLAVTLNDIGVLYVATNEPQKAISYLEQSLEIALRLNRRELIKDNYLVLSNVYENIDVKKSLDYLKKGTNLQDSLLNETKLKYITSLSEKYEAKQRELEIKQLKTDNQIQQLQVDNAIRKKQNTQLVLIATSVVLVLLFFLFISKRKTAKILQIKNDIIKTSLQEKEVLLREIHHRVKNNLQIITGLLELQESLHADEKIGNIVAEAQGRIKTMAIIHEMLYKTEDITKINLHNYIQLLVESIEKGFDGKIEKIIKFYELKDTYFNIDTIIPLGLILNELVTNSYKHVFSLNKGNNLKIYIKNTADENWQLTVADDGLGIPNNGEGEREGSFGLRLVKMLARQLKGNVDYTFNEGANFCITFKELNLHQ